MATYKVKTNKTDYAPGSTATILAEGFTAGSTLEFRVQHVIDPGQDLLWGTIDDVLGNNTGSGHESWFITDGGAGDSDGVADGIVETTWYVNPDDSLGATFLLTATGRMTEPVIVSPDVQPAAGSVTDPVTVAPVVPVAAGNVTDPVIATPAVQVATATFTDSNPIPVQFYYVPKPEDQLLLALQTIESGGPGGDPVNPVQTYISIAAIANGTIIYYDHWEDGYETNIANPTQSTTQIWGDGDINNGVAPGTSNDLITAGTVLLLKNAVDTNVPVMTDYDGGDKIGATKTVAMTRLGWASAAPGFTAPNTLLTSGLEVFDTSNYGTDYKVPVGVNIADGTDFQMFEYTGIFIQAGELTSVVNIDTNADGTIDTTVTLTEGQSYLVNGGVYAGARVLSDNPVRVELITGDIGSNYESRDAALLPVDLWTNSYYTPVSTPSSVVDVGGLGTFNGTDTTVWLYNPGLSAINVTYEYRNSLGVLVSSPLSVSGGTAGGYLKQIIPDGSGAHFFTALGENFYAISTTDSTGSTFSPTFGYTGNQNWDWGFDLVPESSLTTQVLIGLGLGRDPTAPLTALEISNGVPQNGSPAWVTPVGNGETPALIYVDYNGDNLTNTGPVLTDPNGFHYDATISLKELERAKVFDPDGDQTGMLLYTLSSGVKLAAAWGQDPLTASVNRPGIDTGTGVPPLPTFAAGKSSTLLVDADGDGFTSPGDTLKYTVTIPNTSRAPVLGLLLQDTLSIDTSYIPGTTKINRDNGLGVVSLADTGTTPFPFDEGGTILGDMAVGKTFTVTFEAKIDAFADLTPGIKTVINTGKVTALGVTVPILAVDPLYGSIGDFVWKDLDGNGVQDGGAETGIAGVDLKLYLDANNNSILDGPDTLITTKTTDSNGGYLFTGLLAGSYIVDVVDSTVPASYQLTTNNDPKPVALAGGQDYLDADFGYLPLSSISGYVYKDAGDDGIWDGTSAGIANVTVTLTGYNDLGFYITQTAITDADGYYSFTGLRPSDPNLGYTVIEGQPPGYFDGKETVGSAGGDTSVNDQISTIILPAAVDSINNNFGELPPARISGYVYNDAGNDGVWDGTPAGITNVKLTLTGTNDLGNSISLEVFTGLGGRYDFVNLRPGTYTVTESQPTGFLDGKDTAGTATPGSTAGSVTGNDIISGVTLLSGGVSSDNNFGEIQPGALSGFVYVDVNGNGTRQTLPTLETPIPNVTLTLTGTNDLGAITPLTTTTNVNGFYNFGNLRPGTYTVTETHPAGYLDGQDTKGNSTPIAGSNATDLITGIAVVSGAVTPNNNFGELLGATVSGFVYVDANNNGLKESTETGIGSATPGTGVTVTLTGINDLGIAVSLTTTTDANGAYSFTGLRASSAAGYTVKETQPSDYVDGKDTVGSAGGDATSVNDQISGIVVAAGGSSANNNFGELIPVSVSGYVYVDANNDGNRAGAPGEPGIGNVTVTLTGTNDLGNPVSVSTTTLADGSYSFTGLRPSNLFGYTVTETQPASYVDGIDTAGTPPAAVTGNDVISNIVLLNGGDASVNNNFGEQFGSIRGTVYNDVNYNGFDGGDQPLPGAQVALYAANGTTLVSGPVTVDGNGNYVFPNLLLGNYVVKEFNPAGFTDVADTDDTVGGNANGPNTIAVSLTAGIPNSVNNNFLDKQLGSISGTVFNDVNYNGFGGDQPLSGALVALYDAAGTTQLFGPIPVDANGNYTFTDLPLGNYVVKEVNPVGFTDVTDSDGNGNGTSYIAVSLTPGVPDSPNNNFLDVQAGTISGYVYYDENTNGIRDTSPATELGLSGVKIILSGTDYLGNPVSRETTTAADGSYSFGDLPPSDTNGYSVFEPTQPPGYFDGQESKGNVTPIADSQYNVDVIPGIVLAGGETKPNNNFGEWTSANTTPTGLISGTVYIDADNDGVQDPGEAGIGGVTVTLTGIQTDGTPFSRTITTSSNSNDLGSYTFDELYPGTYTITETQPSNYLDGKDTAGTASPGSTAGSVTGNDVISGIILLESGSSPDNNFGERQGVSVSGYVYKDLGNDGVWDGPSNGIGGVTVTLTGTNDLNQAVTVVATTAADGSYSFTGLRPSDSTGYTVTETTQPSGYADGIDTVGSAGGSAAVNDVISGIVLQTLGQSSVNNNFGEVAASISGYVYHDADNDGVKDSGESGIGSGGANIVTLTGLDDLGQSVSLSTTTNASGFYRFEGLRPSGTGGYTVTEILQPSGYLDGKDTAGSPGGGSAGNEVISNITLAAGMVSQNNNFGEILPSSLSGFVYVDSDNDGIKDFGEAPISGVSVTLTGSNDLGNPVSVSTTTLADGSYNFGNLRPGTYTITETQPSAYLDGKDTAGSAGGSVAINDKISNIVLNEGVTSTDNNFGELPKTPGIQIVKDASVAFTSPNVPVTYTYSVTNTGFIPLSNVIVKDDNATPTYAGDDFNPTPVKVGNFNSGDINQDNLLDPTEVWHYTATVIPPVQMTVTTGGTTYESGTLSYIIVSDGPDAGDVRVFYRQSLNFNDNTYGTGSEGWPVGSPHKFSDLTGSDKAGFQVTATDGTVLFKFYQDYITSTTTNTDGYTSFAGFASLGYAGGDGSLQTGGTLNGQAGTLLKDFDSTLEVNLNRAGYTTMTVNSPSSDPNWDKIDGYMFTIDNSAFTTKSFGGVTIFDQHNSPAKTGGSNSYIPDIKGGVSVNTASVTGQGTVNGTPQTLTDDDTASVIVLTGPLGSLGDRIWFDNDADGVQDSGELGIGGVTVLLSGDLNGDGGADYTATAITNASGLYSFTGLPAGNYTVTVNTGTLPSGTYTPTYDLDGISSANTATASLTAGQNRTDFDFGYVATAPGFSVDKSADKAFIAAGGKVTYTYNVANTGSIALSNVVIKDDNGTPGFAEDDFNPTALVQTSGPYIGKNTGDIDGDNLLDPTEVWHYTATVTPPVTLDTVVNGSTVDAGTLIITQTLANGDVRVTYLQDQGVNDNTYGTGAANDWPSGHTFSNLTGSDNATFRITNAAGVQVLLFDMDYISSTTVNTDGYANFSGYASLGLGGDGGLTAGNAAWLTDFDSTLELNLNRAGYTTTIVNSPVGDSNWNNVNGYSFTVKAAAFAGSSFGTATVVEQHNSPSKTGTNATFPTPTDSEVTNTAVVTATLTSNGQSVVAIDDATVSIISGPLGSLGDRVWFDSNANGVQDSGEAGISGLTMLLSGDFDGDGIVEYTATTTTNANGNYTFTGLPAGTYTVTVNSGLPANYTQTYDLDGLSSANMASAELAAGQNRTDVDFGYVGTAPGFSIDKSANKATAAVGESVTYTYLVKNTGSVPLSNIVVKDDNGTPGYGGDDFLATPILSSGYNNGDTNTNNLLDTNETWSYTATVIPPIELSGTVNGNTFDAGTLLITEVQANGDVIVTYRQSQNVNDNTYGTGAASDWASEGGHTFSELTGSDKMGFKVTDGNGNVVLNFYMDYLSSATNDGEYAAADYSGYRSLGVTGGDGSISVGNSAWLTNFDSTLELNLNRAAYKLGYTVNSPIGDSNWDYVNGVTYTIKAAAFGAAGFGGVTVPDQHNSPSKLGVNSFTPVPSQGGASTNTAVVTATWNGQTVVALDDATVLIGEASQPAKFFVIDSGTDDMYKYSASGTAGSSFALQSGNTDPRGVAASADGSMLWVLDKDKSVNVYHADGTTAGLWTASGLGKEPQGISVDGSDLWMVDSDAKKIFWFDNAANNTTGTDTAEKTFTYAASVGTPKGIVTDGTYLWMVNDNASIDHVSRYTIVRDSGVPTGLTGLTSWNMVSANTKATGLTIDPTGASQSIWVVDDGTNQVFEYFNARDGWSSGEGYQTFNLASGNTTPQDIADPRAFIGDMSPVSIGDVDTSSVDSGLNGDALVSLTGIDLAGETLWADASSDDPTDASLAGVSALLDNQGSLDFGSTAVADAQVAIAPADDLVEVVNLATLVSNDQVWMAA